jgi:V/A-type H+-transporting ATPase subunit I
MYGIIMFVLIALVLMKYKIQKEMKMLLMLLMFGGLASAVIGLFFGGYFGIDMGIISEKVPFLGKIQYFDPIGNPLPIFYLSLVLGFIHVVFGVILKIVREAKNNNLKGGLLDQVPWLGLFLTIALAVASAVNLITLPAHTVSVLAGVSVISIILTQGRSQKNIFMKGLMGTLSLYDVIGYFSDTLSYSRLLALGLATSALAFSINMIALLVRDLIPVVGPIAMVVVLVIGHSFNLLVNTLGAFIHSARLQFVEFFGKFILGTGVEFKPFAQLERNVILEEKS